MQSKTDAAEAQRQVEAAAAAAAKAVAGLRPDKAKLEPLEKVTPEAWRAWRYHFESVQAINNWTDKRAKQSIQAAARGTAVDLIRTINLEVDNDAVTWTRALDRLAARFVTPADSDRSRAEYEAASQEAEESLTAYHSRLKTLFSLAHPEVHQAEGSGALITKFLSTLRDDQVSQAVYSVNAPTYNTALLAANQAEARIIVRRLRDIRQAGTSKPSLNSLEPPAKKGRTDPADSSLSPNAQDMLAAMRTYMGGRGGSGRPGQSCYACESYEHQIRDCPHREVYNRGLNRGKKGGGRGGASPQQQRQGNSAGSARPAGQSNFTRGGGSPQRGRGGFGGRGRGRGGRSSGGINYMGEESSAPASEGNTTADYDDASYDNYGTEN